MCVAVCTSKSIFRQQILHRSLFHTILPLDSLICDIQSAWGITGQSPDLYWASDSNPRMWAWASRQVPPKWLWFCSHLLLIILQRHTSSEVINNQYWHKWWAEWVNSMPVCTHGDYSKVHEEEYLADCTFKICSSNITNICALTKKDSSPKTRVRPCKTRLPWIVIQYTILPWQICNW